MIVREGLPWLSSGRRQAPSYSVREDRLPRADETNLPDELHFKRSLQLVCVAASMWGAVGVLATVSPNADREMLRIIAFSVKKSGMEHRGFVNLFNLLNV